MVLGDYPGLLCLALSGHSTARAPTDKHMQGGLRHIQKQILCIYLFAGDRGLGENNL